MENHDLEVIFSKFGEVAEEEVRPKVEQLLEKIETEIKNQNPNALTPIESQLKSFREQKQQLNDQLVEGLSDRRGRHLLSAGFALLFRDLDKIPGGESLRLEIETEGAHFLDYWAKQAESSAGEGSDEEAGAPLMNYTLQSALKISDDSIQKIYSYAHQRYESEEGLEDAFLLFNLLTELNPYQLEPWLYAGICQLEVQNYTDAIHSFSMASMVDFDHFLPHLYCAQCYLALNNSEVAKQSLELAVSLASQEDKEFYRSLIEELGTFLER